MGREVLELPGKILVDEQQLHGAPYGWAPITLASS
jgi:hypothetical protein